MFIARFESIWSALLKIKCFSFEDDSTSTDFFLEGNNSEILKAKKELTENRYLILIRATNKPLPLTATGTSLTINNFLSFLF